MPAASFVPTYESPLVPSPEGDDPNAGVSPWVLQLVTTGRWFMPTSWFAQLVAFLQRLQYAFGLRTLVFLSLMYFFVKGLGYQMLLAVLLPFYKDLNVSATDYQRYYTTAMMGWAAKPLVGCISDNLPIFGYHKRYYLAAFSLTGTLSMLLMLLLPHSSGASVGTIASVFFFCVVLSVASLDLLCEGKYSELLKKKSAVTGAAIISWVYWSYQLGSVAAAAIEGPLADQADPRTVLWCVMPATALLFVPTLLGWLPEDKKQKRSAIDIGLEAPPTEPTPAAGVAFDTMFQAPKVAASTEA